ncbi:hypothetical protein [Gracilimonas mengyeensis]|uniref:Uncharacterized protein n=1 Tax=Gracilimonas mengyeensis TaxID=1302730 RepID=A0A521EDU4_9BACT|nr:hypothetical protein [Gracilimonas mengyeensis]SMO82078.1 hypothetical protein SAMN06265219_111128 [Gracilimonas mengyeensis]
MNVGLTISYIIAGFLTLTILTVSYNVGFSNQEVTTTNIKQTHSQAITQMVISDIPKIGFSQKKILEDPILTAKKHELSFISDLENDGTVRTITWEYHPDITPEHAQNPNKRLLTRTVDGTTSTLEIGVTTFSFRYYSSYGDTASMPMPVASSDLEDIVQIEVLIELQSEYELNYKPSDSGNYVATLWSKRFSPVNLRPN